jgi:hypothetical protein
MIRIGEKGVGLARLRAATASGTAVLLSLVAVVSGLALSVASPSGVAVLSVGAVWYSWLDYRRRPGDEMLRELKDRLDALQNKVNQLQMRDLR